MCVCVLQHASNLEQKQNETENKKVHGDVVKYGTVIQVNNLLNLLIICHHIPASDATDEATHNLIQVVCAAAFCGAGRKYDCFTVITNIV